MKNFTHRHVLKALIHNGLSPTLTFTPNSGTSIIISPVMRRVQ